MRILDIDASSHFSAFRIIVPSDGASLSDSFETAAEYCEEASLDAWELKSIELTGVLDKFDQPLAMWIVKEIH